MLTRTPSWVSDETLSVLQDAVARLRRDLCDVSDEAVVADLDVDGTRCTFALRCSGSVAVDLSPREQEVARMVARGYPNKTIAAVLDISCWTVNTHLRRIFAKLGVRSRAAMVAQVSRTGLLVEDDRPGRSP